MMFGIVDAARDPRLFALATKSSQHVCLFAGDLHPAIAGVAPYLCTVGEDDPLLAAWRTEGWGRSWGILFTSTATLKDLRQQFRKYLQAMLPDGQIVLFRFYDPRVWRTYIPTCSPDQLAGWFQLVSEYAVETPDGTATLRYQFGAGGLVVTA